MAIEAVALKANLRDSHGSKKAALLRKQGLIPAIVYGHGEKPVSIAFNEHDFLIGIHQGSRLFDIEFDNKKEKLLLKDLQYDHLGAGILHADFMRVDLSEKVKVAVPVEIKGTAKGAAEGGMIELHLDKLEVECVVTNIPDSIAVSVKEMIIGQAIHADEIQLPEGVKLITDPTALVVSCHIVAVAKTTEELEAEAPAAPEVITREKKEEEAAVEGEEA